jgi:hypothetical protein
MSRIVSAVAVAAPAVVPEHAPAAGSEAPQAVAAGPASEHYAPAEVLPPAPPLDEHSHAPEMEQPQGRADSSEFDVHRLTTEEQELHRRANRVAKVSMQDIKMLHPDQVRQGRENKDLCIRLKDDIEKAHREYDRRFKPIMDHPVDYFYRWMVEILAEGDASALGEYPYAVTARHH